MKRKLAILLSVLCIFGCIAPVFGADSTRQAGKLYINDTLIENSDAVIFEDDVAWLPLRNIFEKIGAEVEWQSDSNNVLIKYLGTTYICKFFAPNPYFPDVKYFYIEEFQFKDSKDATKLIQLNPMGPEGAYKFINNRVYIKQYTITMLMKYFGYAVDVNLQDKEVKIYKSEK